MLFVLQPSRITHEQRHISWLHNETIKITGLLLLKKLSNLLWTNESNDVLDFKSAEHHAVTFDEEIIIRLLKLLRVNINCST